MTTGAFISSFDWQHSALLGGAIVGGIIVGIGILMESEKWSLAAILVLTGVVIEPIFTIGLFIYDEHLSRGQNAQIISLQRRLAERSLSDAQIADVVDQLKSFSGQHFDVVTYMNNPESWAITQRVFSALIKAGWIYDRSPNQLVMIGVETGIVVWFDKRAEPSVRKTANALTYALLTNEVYAVVNPLIDSAPAAPVTPADPINPRIVVSVGIKP